MKALIIGGIVIFVIWIICSFLKKGRWTYQLVKCASCGEISQRIVPAKMLDQELMITEDKIYYAISLCESCFCVWKKDGEITLQFTDPPFLSAPTHPNARVHWHP